MSNWPTVLLRIDGGEPLDLIRLHILERKAAAERTKALAKKYGAERFWLDEHLRVVALELHEQKVGFTKPDKKGYSRPKRSTVAAHEFASQPSVPAPSEAIANAFGIPLTIAYKDATGEGCTRIGFPMRECGWLWITAEGPYAMWVPDVEGRAAEFRAQGRTIVEEAAEFRLAIPGATRIEQEEWDLLVAEDALRRKRELTKEAA